MKRMIRAVGFAFLSGKYEEDKKRGISGTFESTRNYALCKQKGNMKIVHEIFDYDIDKRVL